MPQPSRPAVMLLDFNGIMTNVDPRDLPVGASEEQVNLCSLISGEMRTRLGLHQVEFDEDEDE